MATFEEVVAAIDALDHSVDVTIADIKRLREQRADLLAACKAALPWVAIATAGRFPEMHPQALANNAEDLALLQAAIAKAEGH